MDWRKYRKSRNHKNYERVLTRNILETVEWTLLMKGYIPRVCTLVAKKKPYIYRFHVPNG